MTDPSRNGPRARTMAILAIASAMTLVAVVGAAAQAPEEALARVTATDAALDAVGGEAGAALWPGFRPDTIPIVYAFRDEGWALANWAGDTLPAGFAPTPAPGIAWRPVVEDDSPGANMVTLGERGWAFVPVGSLGDVALLGLAAHEAFHVWQGAARQEGRYRRGENSALVIEYPEFDPRNEAGVALEGRLLREALEADGGRAARDAAWAFLAVREARHRALDPEIEAFEENAELNEGVAQYVLTRAIELAAAAGDLDPTEAAGEVEDEVDRLGEDLVTGGRTSLRRRYYTTGTALGRLLDALEGEGWKAHLIESGLSLHDLLAEVTGYRAREDSLVARARARQAGGIAELVDRSIEERAEARRARADSVLAAPGLKLVLDSSYLGLCGFDPQNLLRLADGRLLHARWIRFCVPSGTAEFDLPVVHDRSANRAEAVVAEPARLRLEIDGTVVALDALEEATGAVALKGAGVTIETARARVWREEGALRIAIGG